LAVETRQFYDLQFLDMAAFTLAEAQAKLNEWKAAETALATGAQSYSIGGRSLYRADLQWVANRVEYYAGLVDNLSRTSGGIRMRRGIPLDC
jgi:hypothetical protein